MTEQLNLGFLISSLLTPKIVPKLKTRILKVGAIVIIIGYALFIITAHQEGSNIGLQWSQLLSYMFVVGIGLGFAIVPLINVILSRVKIEDAGAASGVLNTMIAVGNAMGIAFIGSIFFGLVGIGSSYKRIKCKRRNSEYSEKSGNNTTLQQSSSRFL